MDLRQRRVLAAGAQQVAQRGEVDAAVAALVEQREGFLVVGRGLDLAVSDLDLVRRAAGAGAGGAHGEWWRGGGHHG